MSTTKMLRGRWTLKITEQPADNSKPALTDQLLIPAMANNIIIVSIKSPLAP